MMITDRHGTSRSLFMLFRSGQSEIPYLWDRIFWGNVPCVTRPFTSLINLSRANVGVLIVTAPSTGRTNVLKKPTRASDRKRFLLSKGLCFNCTGEDHNVTEFKSRKTCLFCKRRHFHLRQGKVRPLDDSGPNWWQSSSLPGSSRGGVSSFALYQILVPEVLTHWPHCARKLEQSFAILECLRLKWCWASAIGWSLSDQILLG